MIQSVSNQAAQRAGRTFQLISDVLADIPTDLDTDQAMRVAQAAIEILSAPTEAEVTHLLTLAVHLGLAAGLTFTIAFALLGLPLLAWGGAACYALALAVYVLHVVTA